MQVNGSKFITAHFEWSNDALNDSPFGKWIYFVFVTYALRMYKKKVDDKIIIIIILIII